MYERPRHPQSRLVSEPPSREPTNESPGVDADADVRGIGMEDSAEGHVVVHGMPVSRASSSIGGEEEEEGPTNRTWDENEQKPGAQKMLAVPVTTEVPPLQLSFNERAPSPNDLREERPSSRVFTLPPGPQENRSHMSGTHENGSDGREAPDHPAEASETQRDADGGTSWRALDPMVRRPELSARPPSASGRPTTRESGALSPGAVSLRSAAQGRSLTPVGH